MEPVFSNNWSKVSVFRMDEPVFQQPAYGMYDSQWQDMSHAHFGNHSV